MTESKNGLQLWIDEDLQGILEVRYRVKRTLLSVESDYQAIDVVETPGFGKMLFNDCAAMVSERDEFIYHEMISHVPMFVHPGVRRVLVIGGGDGGTVREVLRHPSVDSCRLVEIDRQVVEACKEHIPRTAAALDDPRVEVAFEDGVAYVAETRDRYDLVLVDSTDPVGPGEALFGEQFYRNVHRILTDDGIVVSQAQSPFYEAAIQSELLGTLGRLFDRVQLYNYSNLIYPGGLWSFSFASKGDLCPIGDFDAGRVAGSDLSFRYYNAEIHRTAFVHPEFQRRQLAELLTPLKGRPLD